MFIVVTIVAGAVGSSTLQYLFIIPLWLPLFAAGIRRIHDTGRSGWFILVPIYNLVLLVSSKLIVEFIDGDEVLPRPTVAIPEI